MDVQSILKLFFLAAGILFNQLVNTAQNPPPRPEERAKYRAGTLENGSFTLVRAVALLKRLIDLLFALEAWHIFSALYHSATPLPQTTVVTVKPDITAPFIAGFAMMLLGAVARVGAYGQLGRHYTFELAVHKEHQLITEGMYSVVRHPGYVGGLLFLYGAAICQLGRGSYWEVSCAGKNLAAYMFGLVYVLCIAHISVAAVIRTRQEDRVLRAEFGEQWDGWASSVQYRLIPLVY